MAHAYEEAAAFLSKKLASGRRKLTPEVGIICGSGLSNLSETLQNSETFHYSDIPGFPEATVAGHTGELVFGSIGDVACVCMRGRFHYYEGNDMDTVVMPIRALRLLGVKLLIVTNAAGGLNPDFNVGDIMVIEDHFGLPGLAGNQPLRGPNNDVLGPRFPALSDAYDEQLQTLVVEVAAQLHLQQKLRHGTYCYVSGPCYETRAEAGFLRKLGDAVGASTAPEIIASKHCGVKSLGLSLITNKVVSKGGAGGTGTGGEVASHEEVLGAVATSGKNVQALVQGVIAHPSMRAYLDKLDTLDASAEKVPTSPTEKVAPAPSVGVASVDMGMSGMGVYAAVALISGLLFVLSRRT
ncbi:nucleoside phosphorylase domain-containing protein [Ochromonadaceae sp. CCMP2298]|nr:nucleoside phosphorylase domain-containing protein [Ochromonadaceae sp. CCMP2298]